MKARCFWVNPKHEKLFDQDCYPSLEAIREQIDLAIIVIPAKFVNQTIQSAGDFVKKFCS